jgi:hypothetical protein
MTITEFAAVCRMKTRPEDETIGRAALLGSEGCSRVVPRRFLCGCREAAEFF